MDQCRAPETLPPSARLMLLSPHLDDGVFSCGRLLASAPDTLVLTVFSGDPPPALGLTDWDRACGFVSGAQAMAARRREDDAALVRLGARPLRLGFLDRQHCPAGEGADAEAIAQALLAAIGQAAPEAVFLPLGLFHSDHQLACAAALSARRQAPGRQWFAYADALYRALPALVDERLGELRGRGLVATRASFAEADGAAAAKAQAVACYASQLRGITTPGRPGRADLARPERYWALTGEAGA